MPPAGFEPAHLAPEASALSPELRGPGSSTLEPQVVQGCGYHRHLMTTEGKRILICDDDPAILRVLEVNLQVEGYDVLLAHHGQEAYEVAVAEHPDLIILDIMMPRLDGYQTCELLKQNESTNDIPIVFLSAKAQQSDIDRGKESGVADYVTKPFDPTDLLDVVERLLG